jgi:hypothetical protein
VIFEGFQLEVMMLGSQFDGVEIDIVAFGPGPKSIFAGRNSERKQELPVVIGPGLR